MHVPSLPPLNARTVAEFFTSGPSRQRTTLRRYARPPEQQKAPIVMYDPVRKVLPEYFRTKRDATVLQRVVRLLDAPSDADPGFIEKRRKSNRNAIAHLEQLQFDGEFADVKSRRIDIAVQKVRVKSTVDFYATFIPASRRKKPRHVGVIVNPSGIPRKDEADIKKWWEIECEIAFRAAKVEGITLNGILYVDLGHEKIHEYLKPSERLWADIDATCERIVREWKEIRIEASGGVAEA
jgi:hypothetical protein